MEVINRFFSVEFMLKEIPFIASYLPTTIFMAVCATLIGWFIGFFVAMFRINRVPVLNQLAGFYISFIRGTPLMVQIYLTYYGIPIIITMFHALNGQPSAPITPFLPIAFAIIAFSINTGAYSAETIRAIVISIDKGQREAAFSLGLTASQTMRRIVLPQAFRVALPMLCNSFISNVLGTSLAFIVSVVDIMGAAKLVGGRSYRYFEVFVIVAILYWLISSVIQRFTYWLENKLRIPGTS
ncbi:MAG: amino acid ABC transporter permease [Peptococcaceae bacterium]|jgi:His/Glu/Gln/Arg/opine family amino acid ABC transporter permease subunit|nr:amino acid ABC transporter permease [Peptococcaceae bacterium]